MGLADGMYPLFKRFNQRVLKPAIAEINRVSDFRVTVDYQRQGRKVTALKFKIHRVLMLPHNQQPDLFPDLADMPIAVKAMTDAGLPLKDALAVWQQGFEYVEPKERPADIGDNPEHAFTLYVREKIHLLEQRRKGGKVENPGGFLLTAIKKNYTNAKFAEKEARNERQSKVKELRTLKDQKEKIERERDEVLQRACDKVIEAFPEMAERAVDALQGKHNAAFRHCYDSKKSAVENYKGHRFIAETIGQWLESQLPEDFEKKKKPFRSKAGSDRRQDQGAGKRRRQSGPCMRAGRWCRIVISEGGALGPESSETRGGPLFQSVFIRPRGQRPRLLRFRQDRMGNRVQARVAFY